MVVGIANDHGRKCKTDHSGHYCLHFDVDLFNARTKTVIGNNVEKLLSYPKIHERQ